MRRNLIILISLWLALAPFLPGKEYSINRVDIDATIRPDGTVHIKEHRRYTYQGEFRWANYTLQKEGFTKLTGISIRDERGKYIHDSSEKPRSYMITTNEEEINLKWFYDAIDETRTFTLQYTIHGALAVGPDWTEWYWSFIGDGWREPTGETKIRITLPHKPEQDSIYVWLHTSARKDSVTTDSGVVHIHATNLPEEQPLTARILFPSRTLSGVGVNSPELSLAQVRDEEQKRRETLNAERNRQEFLQDYGRPASIILSLISLFIFAWIYRRYGQKASVPGAPEKLYSIPSKDPPALIGWLMQFYTVNGRNLVATIFDLAHRGYFKFHEETMQKKLLQTSSKRFLIEKTDQSPGPGDLLEWERALYEYITGKMTDGRIYFDALTDQRSDMGEWFSNWAEQVKNEAKSRGWRDEESIRGATINGIGQGVILLVGTGLVIVTGTFALVPVIISFVLGLLSFAVIHRTREGERLYQEWKAFKRSLKSGDFTRRNQDLMNRLFVYAVAIGVSGREIRDWIREMEIGASQVPWIVFLAGTAEEPAAVASSMSELTVTGIQTISSVAGGSGASAGSAGGGTGGGAG